MTFETNANRHEEAARELGAVKMAAILNGERSSWMGDISFVWRAHERPPIEWEVLR